MWKSITETLKKINTELKGGAFLSIILTLILLSLFVGYKILAADYPEQKDNLVYQVADIQNSPFSFSDKSHFIYASSRGTKYYYFNCKSSIKEANKIYFETDVAAISAGYSLSKTCK
jgi:hypothetical protein